MMMRATRPIWGKLIKPNTGEIKIDMGKEVKALGGDTYEFRRERLTIHPHIASTDLQPVK